MLTPATTRWLTAIGPNIPRRRLGLAAEEPEPNADPRLGEQVEHRRRRQVRAERPLDRAHRRGRLALGYLRGTADEQEGQRDHRSQDRAAEQRHRHTAPAEQRTDHREELRVAQPEPPPPAQPVEQLAEPPRPPEPDR